MKTIPDWKVLEDNVRLFASLQWDSSAKQEKIEGINFDAVLYLPCNTMVLMEVTKNLTLEKIRDDIHRLSLARSNLFAKGTLANCYIILSKQPTPSMIESAKGANINILSYQDFISELIDFPKYVSLRSTKVFGSAIDPSTGNPDEKQYIQTTYSSETGAKKYPITKIKESLLDNKKIILLGEYGTGKSRCTKEVFSLLTSDDSHDKFVLSINLREHWGANSAEEIIVGHLKRVGFTSNLQKIMSLLEAGKFILILDGFDEVGSQTFGIDPQKRLSIRKKALQGVSELISLNKSGVLVTGRPHYFNSNEEMFDCLGISTKKANFLLIKCAEEFDNEQSNTYLKNIGVTTITPSWLPKKPLIFQILAAMPLEKIENIFKEHDGKITFWGQFLDAVCEREANIHSSISPDSVRQVLIELSKITRLSNYQLGRLTQKDFNECYEKATGESPDEAGHLMLSRLCTLGRIEPESPDRQFVDLYIIQLLFAENFINDISNKDEKILNEKWKQSLTEFGIFVLSSWIEIFDLLSETQYLIYRLDDKGNAQAISELLSAISLLEIEPIDLSGIQIKFGHFPIFALGNTLFTNVKFNQCTFDELTFEKCLIDDSACMIFDTCLIDTVTGFAAEHEFPKWLINCTIDNRQNTSNSSRIKDSNLPASQKLLLSIIQKIFFQHGGGRQESALYKGGYSQKYDKELIDKILAYLVREGFIEQSKDGSKFIYNPVRLYTSRMKAIKDQLSLSQDSIWLDVLSFESKAERKGHKNKS